MMRKNSTYLKLPFQFDQEKLAHDLSLIMEGKWVAHFNTNGYKGDWKAISLYAPGGDDANIFALSASDSEISETSILKKCLYLKEVIGSIKCPILTARLLRLGVGAEIKAHRDHELGYENNNFRLHIPICTNSKVQFVLDGKLLKMLPGECWYTNVNYVHSVLNAGKSERVHLVIDYERNEWSDQLFFSLAPERSFKPEASENHSLERVKMILEELKHHDTPATHQLINELKLKLIDTNPSIH